MQPVCKVSTSQNTFSGNIFAFVSFPLSAWERNPIGWKDEGRVVQVGVEKKERLRNRTNKRSFFICPQHRWVRQLKQGRSLYLPCIFFKDQKWPPYPVLFCYIPKHPTYIWISKCCRQMARVGFFLTTLSRSRDSNRQSGSTDWDFWRTLFKCTCYLGPGGLAARPVSVASRFLIERVLVIWFDDCMRLVLTVTWHVFILVI